MTRLTDALSARGADVQACHPAALADLDPAPDLCLCRMASGRPEAELSALLVCEDRGWQFLDAPSRIARVHDKARLLGHLAECGLPTPPTLCVTRDAQARLDDLPGSRFVVKPVRGASGRGVTIGLDRAAAARAADAFADLSGPVIVQSLVGDGTDLRLFVLDGEVVSSMRRQPARRDGRGNLAYGAQALAHEPQPEELELALAAAAATDLMVAGIDLIHADDGRVLVLEVNSCPGLLGIEAATGHDLSGRLADLALARAIHSGSGHRASAGD